MKVLRSHLQDIRSQIVSVSEPGGCRPTFAQTVRSPQSRPVRAVLVVWLSPQGLRDGAITGLCLCPIALEGRKSENRRGPGAEGLWTWGHLWVYEILTILVTWPFTNHRNHPEVTYCAIFRKCREASAGLSRLSVQTWFWLRSRSHGP